MAGSRTRGGVEADIAEVAPAATTRRPPAWRSPRFGLGVILVAGSVALGSWAVQRASAGEPVWVARHDLAPGDVVTADDLRRAPLAWDGDGSVYVGAESLSPDAVITSFVGAGEILPASALGTAADVTGRPVPVPVPAGVVLTPGALVDLWAVSGDSATPPVLLAEAVVVLGVEEDSGLLRSSSGTVARVLVAQDAVAAVLTAQADAGTLTLVERPGA